MNHVIYFDTQLLSMVAGLCLPLLIGLMTKLDASSATKAVANAVLAVVTGIVTTALTSPADGIPAAQAAYAIVLAAVSSWASYKGLWKPAGVTDAIQSKTASFGVGKG